MQALQQTSTSGRSFSCSYINQRTTTQRVRVVRVQAAANTQQQAEKAVLAPPYNVLITGSTKGAVVVRTARPGAVGAHLVRQLPSLNTSSSPPSLPPCITQHLGHTRS